MSKQEGVFGGGNKRIRYECKPGETEPSAQNIDYFHGFRIEVLLIGKLTDPMN